jgi:ribosomal-protein-alanine N-acetyltransferase
MVLMDVRLADSNDRQSIIALLRAEQESFLRIPISNIDDILNSRLVIKATQENRLVGCLLSIWSTPPLGWLDAVVIDHRADWSEVFQALLRTFEGYLSLRGATKVYCSVEDGIDGLIRLALKEQGYEQTTRFIRYTKHNFLIPVFRLPRINVRKVQRNDIPMLAKIETASFSPPWQMDDKALNQAASRYSYFRVAENTEGKIVGYQYSHVKDETGYFIHLAVSPAARGINIGKVLLTDAMAHFQGCGVQSVEVRTEQSNRTARRLYCSFGFKPNGASRAILMKDLMAEPQESRKAA